MRTRLLLLGSQTIALGLMMAFLVVPVSALFLDEYGADALPYAYLAVAVAGVAVSSGMSRAQRRFSLANLAAVVVGGYLVAVAVGWAVLAWSDRLWVTFPLLVLFPLSIPIGFVLVGSQAGRLLDVRQMKAHFPRVAAGFSAGFALGGLAAAALVGPLGGPRHLLGLDVLAAAAMLGLVLVTSRVFPAQLATPPEPQQQAAAAAGPPRRRLAWRGKLGNRMVALVLAYQVLSAAVTQLLDFMVWERAAARYPDPSSLAQFQGLFGAVINVVSVLFVVVAAGWLLTRFGIGFGLAANPAAVLVLLVATTVAGYGAGAGTLLFFGLVCAQQVTDISLTDGTTRASINGTYQALRADERLRAQTMVEGAGVPLALGFVGLLLIVYDAVGLGIRAVVVVTLLLTVLWVWAAVLAYREYGAKLRDALSRRAWDPVALRVDDPASRAAVDQLLLSEDPHDVQAGLDALADTGRDVSAQLLALLTDRTPARRVLGLQMAVVTGHLEHPEVAERSRVLLEARDGDVASYAAAALVRISGAGREEARSAWLTAVASADHVTLHRALAAASVVPHGFFVPHLVGLAASESTSGDVLDALAAHCDHLAPHVEGFLADPAVPRQVRKRVIHFLGRAETADARDLLVAHLDGGDPAIVEAAGACLRAVGHKDAAGRSMLGPRLVDVASRVRRSLRILVLLDDRPEHQPLRTALDDEITAAGRRAEVLLDLAFDARAIGSAVSELASPEERNRNTALEMLEVTVGRSVAVTTLALLDPRLDHEARLHRLDGHESEPTRILADWLRDLIEDRDGHWDDPWLRACALYGLPAELPGEAATELATAFLHDPDPDVAETARWVTQRSTPPTSREVRVPTS